MPHLPHCHEPTGRVRLVAMVLQAELARAGRLTRQRLGVSRPAVLDSSTWRAPDSRLARDAEELLRAHSADHLIQHCHRTYAFGMAIAMQLEMQPDRELFYVAALLHDLGLTPHFADDAEPFEWVGARAARRFCESRDVPEKRIARVHQAIAHHTSLRAATAEPEAALVHFGAGLDVLGYRAEDVARETVERILTMWPRGDFKRLLIADLKRVLREGGDGALEQQWQLGFRGRIEKAPFPS